ncbi:MAG TPA: alpha/beta hydrolase [Burkholderiaceae bacterium]|nr:alpha/beta hydrolase [Burkholderiaceae bacterium]
MTSVNKPLDPAIAEMGRRTKASGIPDLYEGCLEPHGGPVCRERGRNLRAFFYPKPTLPTGKIESLVIDGAAYGVDAQIPVRIHWPQENFVTGTVQNTLVYFHGGGFVVGDLDSHDAHAIRLANEAQCVVVNVDYRLAPEHRFPAAYDDCWAVTQWVAQNISRLGGHVKRLAVGGDSAGGNLAAAVALACRDCGLKLAAQLLLYPATDLTQLNGMPEQAYLGAENISTTGRDWRASPKLAASHAGLAPAILTVGAHDFLFKDNQAYAQVLRNANVALTYREFPTLNHGFFSFTAISQDSLIAAQMVCADLKTHFQNAG